jgi:hypothetical protein
MRYAGTLVSQTGQLTKRDAAGPVLGVESCLALCALRFLPSTCMPMWRWLLAAVTA